MNILFIHGNFPGQLGHWAEALCARGHAVRAIGGQSAKELVGIPVSRYRLSRGTTPGIFPFAVRYEADCMRGEAVALIAAGLKRDGFCPDVVVGHPGWGEMLFLREVWPEVKIIAYAEFYYQSRDSDTLFDLELDPPDLTKIMRAHAKSGCFAMSIAECDIAVSPTRYQRSRYPMVLQSRIQVIHEGIDTINIRPRSDAWIRLSDGTVLKAGDEVVTHVNRNLEPVRGIHVFLRALPAILAARPDAHVLIVGSPSDQAYGTSPPDGKTWKDVFLDEVRERIDPTRVHWVGSLDRAKYLGMLAVSAVHVYLTYPFVLSWSLLEAMSAGCLVVASDTAPVREIIEHGRNGLLFPFFDHGALSKLVIEALRGSREAFSKMTGAARETIVQGFDRDTVCTPRLVELVEASVKS